MIKWGILSTAKIGVETMIPAILNANNGIVTAIASRNIGKAQSVAARFNISKAYGTYEDLLADKDVDAIYIPLITSEHVKWTIKAADAGKHVLCEKPISLKAREIDQIIEAQVRNNVVICEAFMVTYHPQWHKVRELVQGGAIGTLTHVQAAFTYFNDDAGNMRNIKEQGGGALLDIGVYPIVATRFVTGAEPTRVQADIQFHKTFKTDAYASARLDFGSFELSMYVSTQMALRQTCTFHGDKGWIELASPFNAGKYADTAITISNAGHDAIQTIRFPGIDQYQLEAEAFGRQVLGQTQPEGVALFSLASSKNNQRAIDAIFAADGKDGWVEV